MKTTKKLFSLVLVIIMVACTMPLVYAEGETYAVGDLIQFGSYPQSQVKDEALISTLGNLAPYWDECTSYRYYSGNGEIGSMTPGDWMKYADVTYNGNTYRGVKFTQYRPYNTYSDSSYISNQRDNGYTINTVYWFKFEPIFWYILDPNTGLALCKNIIDAQPYSNTLYYNNTNEIEYTYFGDSDFTNYASNYETSSIRAWLNEDFYKIAFTDNEKEKISITTLNNDGYYTSIGNTDYKNLDSAKTNDKVFLLSYNDVCNSNYGFNSNLSIADIARRVQGTDYAESQGLNVFKDINSPYHKNSKWILRSPGDFSGGCCGISYYGFASFDYSVDITEYGIRPALIINQLSGIKHTHNYSSNVIVPTCTTKGYTVSTCQCGDNYIANYVDIVNHKDSDNNYKCDFNCGYKFENPADSCSCNCHARGLKAFFFKISIFFQKLFGKNQICACGAIHY